MAEALNETNVVSVRRVVPLAILTKFSRHVDNTIATRNQYFMILFVPIAMLQLASCDLVR